MTPDAGHRAVKASGLRGRGGAGFPTGLKWQFVDKKSPKPKYIACNADESEPGTFKDHLLMERNPHLLIEGCADRLLRHRREGRLHLHPRRVLSRAADLETAIDDARKAGFLGKNILGSGFDCEVYVHRGAGAYEAGEETALLESLEGKRAQPRIQAAVPGGRGRYGSARPRSTTSRRSATCRSIVTRGAEWFAVARAREERRAEAVLRQRPRASAPASSRRR